ncbi:dolichyl-phosphate-mannose-protein mannosyltransferase [Chitinophaga dinghuensis]|uniref:Dolichyl-phosphate-mannose-protein mannosyltransferase n=1 Tax=Chitinophaga dinghuensis TaxID=1539050 RepID=A0A327VX82_9BACT|nr:hypothetical protein [Chitinophaga dinghuensis]RAJ79943.1 dolichyl-phosphate-mannose-protein mannosyltransferase [Chitinophaga dinghuensis]
MNKRLLLILGIGGYAFLLLITLLHHQPPLFDEPLFVRNLFLMEQEGLSSRFLLEMNDQAPGPLYQMIHYPLYFLTRWQMPGLRLVNMTLLAGITFMLIRIIVQHYKINARTAFLYALNIMAVPMIWQVSGMALTEIPPIFFSLLAIYWLLLGINPVQSVTKSILYSLLAGAAMGLAVLGRSPFIVMIPASGVLLLYHWRDSRRWMLVILFAVTALAICAPVIYIWKGLMPPKQALVAAGGFSLWHGILAFAYGAMMTIIIAPSWFIYNRRILLGLLVTYVVLAVLNIFVLHYSYAPLSEALEKVLPAALMRIYPFVISPVLATIALYYVASSLYQAWKRREEETYLFLLASCLLILATSCGVTHLFSSRYVAQAAGLAVLLLVPYDRISYWKLARFAVGMLIGLLSLETYFLFR